MMVISRIYLTFILIGFMPFVFSCKQISNTPDELVKKDIHRFLNDIGIDKDVSFNDYFVIEKYERGFFSFILQLRLENKMALDKYIAIIDEKFKKKLKGKIVDIAITHNDKNHSAISFELKKAKGQKFQIIFPNEKRKIFDNLSAFKGFYINEENSTSETIFLYDDSAGYLIGINWKDEK